MKLLRGEYMAVKATSKTIPNFSGFVKIKFFVGSFILWLRAIGKNFSVKDLRQQSRKVGEPLRFLYYSKATSGGNPREKQAAGQEHAFKGLKENRCSLCFWALSSLPSKTLYLNAWNLATRAMREPTSRTLSIRPCM